MCVCCVEVLFKVYCSDHTYSTIRVPVSASVREVIAAVTDKLGSGDDLLLIHLNSAGGEHTHTQTSYFFHSYHCIDSHFLCFHWCLINCRVINSVFAECAFALTLISLTSGSQYELFASPVLL